MAICIVTTLWPAILWPTSPITSAEIFGGSIRYLAIFTQLAIFESWVAWKVAGQ